MSLLQIAGMDPAELREIVALGRSVKSDPDRFAGTLTGRSVGLFFAKPSLRTWVSSDVAVAQLGGHPLLLRDSEVGVGSREAPEDVGRVLDRYLDLLAMRVYGHGDLERVAGAMRAPVVNLLSDREHPCQAIADVMTIDETVGIDGARVAYIGDGNNVCQSLILAVTKAGGSIAVATPPGDEPDEAVVAEARGYGAVALTTDPEEAVEGADVVYTDVWASMGQESEAAARKERFARFRVDEALMARAAGDAVFLHCLPAHRGDEVTDGVIDGPRSRVFDQAENRLHGFKAVLLHLLG
jgi:ornithine carbamoyltransferase